MGWPLPSLVCLMGLAVACNAASKLVTDGAVASSATPDGSAEVSPRTDTLLEGISDETARGPDARRDEATDARGREAVAEAGSTFDAAGELASDATPDRQVPGCVGEFCEDFERGEV